MLVFGFANGMLKAYICKLRERNDLIMQRTHWIKGVACLGAAMTLSLASCVTLEDATASGLCGETEMAGISLALDKYYSATYAEETEVVSTEVAATTQAASLAAITTQSAVTTQAAVSAPVVSEAALMPEVTTAPAPAVPEPKKKEKKEKVSKRYRTLGISIASDYVNIRKNSDTSSKILGKLYRGSSAKILSMKGKWVRIQSGDVTGYIKKEFLAIGADAQALADKYGIKHASLKPGTITLKVRAKTSTKSTVLTLIPEDERYSVINETENWAKITIDDGTEGYVAKEFVNISVSYKHAVSIKEEKAKIARRKAAERAQEERLEQLAKERREREEAQKREEERQKEAARQEAQRKKEAEKKEEKTAQKKQNTSSKEKASSNQKSSNKSSNSNKGSQPSYTSSSTGEEIANYAKKFVGNPYVYGGSSLTNGTDCSGFTMSIYAQFGYSIPRTSRAQSTYGKAVSLSSLKPGDLIFYRSGSTVGHVALYIGGGKVVHASNPSDGIKISNINYRRPCSARRIVG